MRKTVQISRPPSQGERLICLYEDKMKKLLSFLRSMRFGIVLLILIALCSVAGSLLPQERGVAWYAQNYPQLHGLILTLGLHRVYQSWYFLTLLGLLCLNLTLCSVLRLRRVVLAGQTEAERTAALPDRAALPPEKLEAFRAALLRRGCRETRVGDAAVYRKRGWGRYGSFLTHLAILLTLLCGAAVLFLQQVTDQSCLPGDSVQLPDGAAVAVASFRIEDETGRLDYASEVQLRLPDGRASVWKQIRVNEPLSFGPYKVYQQTYGTAGAVRVENAETGGADELRLTEPCFLSLDGVSGVWYEAIYPGYLRDENGDVTLITSTSGSYPDPVYQVLVVSAEGDNTPVLAFPGETLELGVLRFTFLEPVEYPGLRIKYTPPTLLGALFAAFGLMLIGLWMCFFTAPVAIKLDSAGWAVGGPKPEAVLPWAEALLDEIESEEETI